MSNNKSTTLKDIMKTEYAKCVSNPIYFMKKYVKIQHPTKGTLPFETYPFQDDTLTDFINYDRSIVLKSRQMGISTLVAGYSLWLMTFHESKDILCLSITQETAKAIVTKVRFGNDNLPSWLKQKIILDNQLSLKLKNGSQIKAVSSTGASGRSAALSLLIIDEAAFIQNAQDLWLSAQSTLSTGGKAIILSCVVADTYVFDKKLGLTQVKSYINKDADGSYEIKEYEILGKDGFRKGNLFHNNGYVKTKKIITKFSELECSYNHKVWAYIKEKNEYGWKKAEELSVGDYVSMQAGLNVWNDNDSVSDFLPSTSNKIKNTFSPTNLTPEICYFLGLYISEGSVYKKLNKNGDLVGGCVTITCGDGISFVFDRLGLNYCCVDGLHYCISNKNLIEFLEYLGFDLSLRANSKKIPQRLMSMSKENIAHLLRGIFDGDGWGENGRVGLVSTSKELIDQVRMLLINFGILSSRFYYSKEIKNKYLGKIKHNHDSHSIEMYGRQALKYYNIIGFGVKRKMSGKSKVENKNLHRSCSHDVIPNTLGLINKLYKLSGHNTSSIKENFGLTINSIVNKRKKYKTNNISADNVRIMYNNFKFFLQDYEIDFWDAVIGDNLHWCEIKDIKESKNNTYDFSLPETNDRWCHSVIYNGILGHQTPNGVGNFFHKMWMESEEDLNDFRRITLPWHLHPDRDQSWRDNQTKLLGERGASQECDCVFSTSGNTVIEIPVLDWHLKNTVKEPQEKRGVDRGLWIWEYAQEVKSYMVTADVARGDGDDFSAAQVIDIESMEQVAEYKGKIPTKDYAKLLMTISTEYNSALLVVENANVGWAVIQELIDKSYSNLFYSSADLQYVDVENQITNKLGAEEKNMKPGFTTSSKTRPLIISKMEAYIRDKDVIIRSSRLIDELKVFIWKNSGTNVKAEAMSGYNDDLVISMGISLWVRDIALRLRNEKIALNKATLNSFYSTSAERSDVVSSRPGILRGGASLNKNPWSMEIGEGENEDLTWLLK